MPISREQEWIFVHVPKTAGTSIEVALDVHGDWRVEDRERLFGRIRSADLVELGSISRFLQHLTLPEVRAVLPASASWFSFSFVRNPWDRMVSIHSRPDPQLVSVGHSRGLQLDQLSFEAFLDATADLEHAHLRPQADYVTDGEGRLLVDYLGRFERLEADFEEVCRRLGSTARLTHENRSPGRDRRRDYRSYYDERTRELVAQRYRRDVEAFGYEF